MPLYFRVGQVDKNGNKTSAPVLAKAFARLLYGKTFQYSSSHGSSDGGPNVTDSWEIALADGSSLSVEHQSGNATVSLIQNAWRRT